MKTQISALVLIAAALPVHAAVSLNQTPQVIEAGPNHQVWAWKGQVTGPDGKIHERVQHFEELGSGLNKWDGQQGRWKTAQTDIGLAADRQSAKAAGTAHEVQCLPNASQQGVFTVTLPGGGRFKGHLLGLSFHSLKTGDSVWIAEVKAAQGVVDGSRVVYQNCLDNDVAADWIIEVSKDRVSSSVVLKEALNVVPEDFGMDSGDCLLEAVTEWQELPGFQKSRQIANGKADEMYSFPDGYVMGHGKAFLAGVGEVNQPAARVFKEIAMVQGRALLFEGVEWKTVRPWLTQLEEATPGPMRIARKSEPGLGLSQQLVFTGLMWGIPLKPTSALPALRLAGQGSGGEFLAYEPTNPAVPQSESLVANREGAPGADGSYQTRGLVLDWELLSTISNLELKSGYTYRINGAVNCTGTTKIGAAVVKYAASSSAQVNILGPVICQTEPYRMLICTSVNDDSVGETLPGSTGTPASYGGYALYFDSYTSGVSYDLKHIRVNYAATALGFFGEATVIQGEDQWWIPHTVSHVQLGNATKAAMLYYAEVRLRNALVWSVNSAFLMPGSTLRAEHLTVDSASSLLASPNGSEVVCLTNSILAGVAQVGTYAGSHVVALSSSEGVFEAAGAGLHYLPAYSPHRRTGVAVLSPDLASTLTNKTTTAPVIIESTIGYDTTLGPMAVRVDPQAPDLGYLYDPVDAAVGSCIVDNATMKLQNGVAVATFDWVGFSLKGTAQFISEGQPARHLRNRIVRYQAVQESPMKWGGNFSTMPQAIGSGYAGGTPTVKLRFTDMEDYVTLASHLYRAPGWDYALLDVRDCGFYGGQFYLEGADTGAMPAITLRNNLM